MIRFGHGESSTIFLFFLWSESGYSCGLEAALVITFVKCFTNLVSDYLNIVTYICLLFSLSLSLLFFFFSFFLSFAIGSALRSCLKVEVAVLGSPSLIVLVISVDVKQH